MRLCLLPAVPASLVLLLVLLPAQCPILIGSFILEGKAGGRCSNAPPTLRAATRLLLPTTTQWRTPSRIFSISLVGFSHPSLPAWLQAGSAPLPCARRACSTGLPPAPTTPAATCTWHLSSGHRQAEGCGPRLSLPHACLLALPLLATPRCLLIIGMRFSCNHEVFVLKGCGPTPHLSSAG